MSVVSPNLRTRVRGIAVPIAVAMGKVGLTPNGLTLIGFAIAIVAAIVAGLQGWILAGVLVVFGGVFDLFDGALARATGKAGPLGAFMDSVFDRWGEAIVYLGIVTGAVLSIPHGGDVAVVGPDLVAILGAAAMGAAFMVSYARAKSEGLGFTEGTGMAAVGIMPREVRLVVLSLGLVITGITGSFLALLIALAVITIGSILTVIQRILHVRSQARAATTTPRNQ